MESPLDPFLTRFLALMLSRETGFTPGHQTKLIAKELHVQKAFVDALFVSARTRYLLTPAFRKGGKVHWLVSERGQELIQRTHPDEPRPAAISEPTTDVEGTSTP